MPVSVTLPALGESVTEGTVTRWLKREGEQVAADEPLLEISTDKVDTEIPAPAAGVLLKITVGEEETVAVGAELAVIGEAGESPADAGQDAGGSGGQVGEQQGAVDPPAPQTAQVETEPREPAPQPEPAQPQPAAGGPAEGSGSGADGTSVVLPALGESVTEGTVTRWLKQEGDTVAADEPLLEISTDKVDTEIPAPVAGVLVRISVREDETVAVGAELAVIGAADAAAPSPPPAPQAAPAPAPASEAQPPPAPAPTPPPRPEPAQQAASTAPSSPRAPAGNGQGGASGIDVSGYVTPLVRKLAADNNIDLGTVAGTGVGGRIRKQDVLDAAREAQDAELTRAAPAPPAPSSAPAPRTESDRPAPAQASPAPVARRAAGTEPMSRLRKVIAGRMVESLQTSAQLTSVVEVDITRIARLRDVAKAGFEAREGARLSFLPFFGKAVVEALAAHPKLNASIDAERGEITYHGQTNLGVAVDTERGLLVPVVRNADDLNIAGLTRKVADLAARTRENKITPDELTGGTFTLTNTGSRGALFDTPIINQPQVAILGTGTVVKRPVVIDDPQLGETIAIRSMVYLALTYDHRLVDGADAARFLVTVKQRLEAGAFEAELGL